jgi:hypothetical protein
MNFFWMITFILVVAVGLFGTWIVLRERLAQAPSNTQLGLEFRRKKKFFTKSEWQCYSELQKILGEKYIIFPKVRLTDVLESVGEDRFKHYSRVRAMHFDFLILSLDFVPLLALELDGSSHHNQKQQKSDATKNAACQAAGFRLERILVGESPIKILGYLETA